MLLPCNRFALITCGLCRFSGCLWPVCVTILTIEVPTTPFKQRLSHRSPFCTRPAPWSTTISTSASWYSTAKRTTYFRYCFRLKRPALTLISCVMSLICPLNSPRRRTRAVRKVSSHFENLENRSRGLDVTWQPVRGDLTVCTWTVTLLWG